MLTDVMHTIAHGGCANTIRESALKVDWEKNPLAHRGVEPTSVTLPTELHPRLPFPWTTSSIAKYAKVYAHLSKLFVDLFLSFAEGLSVGRQVEESEGEDSGGSVETSHQEYESVGFDLLVRHALGEKVKKQVK